MFTYVLHLYSLGAGFLLAIRKIAGLREHYVDGLPPCIRGRHPDRPAMQQEIGRTSIVLAGQVPCVELSRRAPRIPATKVPWLHPGLAGTTQPRVSPGLRGSNPARSGWVWSTGPSMRAMRTPRPSLEANSSSIPSKAGQSVHPGVSWQFTVTAKTFWEEVCDGCRLAGLGRSFA